MEVKNIIEEMNIRKAGGIDDIQPFMVKYGLEIITTHLTSMLNKLYNLGEFLKEWKIGEIVAIPKNNKKEICVDELMPITLLPIFGKIFEKIIYLRLNKIVEENKWLPKVISNI